MRGGFFNGHQNHTAAGEKSQRPAAEAVRQLQRGNCLLLDDGEPCVCVQSISKYGIYCNYFKNAVLPVDEGLHAEIMKPTGGKHCVLCRQAFASRAKNQRYCPACAAKQKRLKAAERQRRKRASASRF